MSASARSDYFAVAYVGAEGLPVGHPIPERLVREHLSWCAAAPLVRTVAAALAELDFTARAQPSDEPLDLVRYVGGVRTVVATYRPEVRS